MMKRARVLIAGAILVLLAGATPLGAAQGGCVDVELSITPDPVCRGEVIQAEGSVTNCGDRRDVVELTFTITTPFGPALIGQTTVVLRDGETRSDSIVSTVPQDTPLGIYTVTVDAISRHGGEDSATATVEVIECPSRLRR